MTKIEWTHVPDGKGGRKKGETLNPLVGCTKISPGCANCYAADQAHLHAGSIKQHRGLTIKRDGMSANWNGKINRAPDQLAKPLRRRKPRGIFWGSMTDIFHESTMATDDGRRYIAACFGVMAATPQHTHMVVTKRPGLMREWFEWIAKDPFVSPVEYAIGCAEEMPDSVVEALDRATWTKRGTGKIPMPPWPLEHVWLLTTSEDQKRADERTSDLLACPAAVHGLSIEPMLGPVVLPPEFLALGKHGWVITGGESGSRARPSHPKWFRDIRDQATSAGVPYFHKQWGEHAPVDDDDESWTSMVGIDGKAIQRGQDMPLCFAAAPDVAFVRKVGKKKAGRELDGRTWDEFPEV